MPSRDSGNSRVEILDIALSPETMDGMRRQALKMLAVVTADLGGMQAVADDADAIRRAPPRGRLS